MLNIRRLTIFASRWVAARNFGFAYRGTTKTKFPTRLLLHRQVIPLAEPLGKECIYDIFNVLLDDEYGLGSTSPAPRVIVDIGVNMGIFAMAAWHHFPDARFLGYEPNPRAFRQAKENLRLIGATIHNEAVSDVSGTCCIADHTESRLARTVSSGDGTVTVTAFRDVLNKAGGTIDLLKMDCEGAEWSILNDHVSIRAVATIRMEFHLVDGHSLDELYSKLSIAGHNVIKCVNHGDHGIVWTRRTG